MEQLHVRRHHTGSGRRQPIPAGWTASMAAVVEERFTQATVNLRHEGGTTGYNSVLGRTVTTPYPPFATGVPAGIEALTTADVSPTSAVEDQVRVLGYRVSVPYATAPDDLDEGVMVDVVTCDDPMLAGATFHVTDIVRGPLEFARDLICDLNT